MPQFYFQSYQRCTDYEKKGDEIGKSVIYQYLYAIVSVLSGFLFYIYIVRVFTTEVVGVVALLSAMMILFSTIFGVGLSFGVQHFISYYLGKKTT